MTHLSDDDLVLHYYGELPEGETHLAACAACATRARELALLLSSVPDDVPERGELYGREVWYRVRPCLDGGGARLQWRLLRFAAPRWILASAAVAVLVASGFVAGRLSLPSPATTGTARLPQTADADLPRRVLLLSVADHFERSDRVLTDVMNAPGSDISAEQQWAGDLIATNRLYRQDALDANEASIAAVLDELERILLDIVHRPDGSSTDLEPLRERIDSAALLFKLRVMANELRQRQLAPDTEHPTRSVSPIS